MVKMLSFIIAFILTVMLVCILYPIAALFWVIGKAGKIIGIISDWIFAHANSAVKHLWADLRNSSNEVSG